MKKFVPALFIILMTGLIGAKVALADANETEVARQQVGSYEVRL
jgi:hypothetical protein